MSGSRCRPGWGKLSVPERCRLVRRLARRLAQNPPERFADWGVVGVGAGWRVRESEGNRVIRGRTPVVSFMVRRKQRKDRLRALRLIPSCWPVLLGKGKNSRVYRVPIDVCRSSLSAVAYGLNRPGFPGGSFP